MLTNLKQPVKGEITFTVIESSDCSLAKRFSIGVDGTLESNAVAHMTSGAAKVTSIASLDVLVRDLLPALKHNQAITCGVPFVGDTRLTTRAGTELRTDAVARTNEAFCYPAGPALFPIDVDIDDKHTPYATVDAVLDALESCSPRLRHAHRVARPSSSSYVSGRGLRGVHVYIAVTNGAAGIDALGKRLQFDQWRAEKGWIKISKVGALLVRQISDAAVYQPSRLMFEAAPEIGAGVERVLPGGQAFVERTPDKAEGRLPAFRVNGMIDVSQMERLRDIEKRRHETHLKKARDDQRREAKRVALNYQKEQAIASGLDAAEGERLGLLAIRALGDKKLPTDWTLFVKDIGRVKVADILTDLDVYIGKQCADPFDTWRPDIDAKHCAKAEIVMRRGVPGVWSHKLQEFLEFTTVVAANIASPLEQAAEKLSGLIEYPEKAGKAGASELNTAHALDLLLREARVALRYNKATYSVEDDEVPGALALKSALARVGCFRVNKNTLENAIGDAARAAAYDPWHDAVLALPKWDGVPRLDTFFPDLCDATPSAALTLTTQLLFAGIVRRQLEPGAQCPVVPVLIGKGGTGKTRFVHELARSLGVPAPASLTFSDAIRMSMSASVSAIAELGEMSGMAKRDMDDIKQWITECEDVYRAPYDRKSEAHERRFALIGTANKDELNRDETGNRRFMPVFVNKPLDRDWTVEAKQVFAEAKKRFCECAETYSTLVDAAQRAVFAFNEVRMQRGEGTPQTVVSEIAPSIVRSLAGQRPNRRVFVGDLLTQLASSTTVARTLGPKQVGAWMRMNGWASGTSNGMTYFIVPDAYLQCVDDDASVEPNVSPFARPSLAAAA